MDRNALNSGLDEMLQEALKIESDLLPISDKFLSLRQEALELESHLVMSEKLQVSDGSDQVSDEVSSEVIEPDLRTGQSIGDSQAKSVDAATIENRIRRSGSDSFRDNLARDERYRTLLAIELEVSAKNKIADLLKLGAASSIFVRDSRPRTMLCTLPFARHPPDSENMSIAGGMLAQTWRESRGKRCDDAILNLLDEALASEIRKVRFHGTVSVAQTQLKSDAKTAPSNASAVSVSIIPGSVAAQCGETFGTGDRVRLVPNQDSPTMLADWAWGPHNAPSMRISEAGLRAEGLRKADTSSFSSILGSRVFMTGKHRWEIQFQRLPSCMCQWVGIAAVDQIDKCNFTSNPSNFGPPVAAFRNDRQHCNTIGGTLENITTGNCFTSGQIITLDLNIEQEIFKMFVDGILVCQICGITMKGNRPFVCVCTVSNSEIIHLGARLTSDLDLCLALSDTLLQASLHCLGTAEECREGVVLEVKDVKIGFAQKTLVKVASVGDGTIAVFPSEALMLADCLSTAHITVHKQLQTSISSAPTACLANDIPANWGTALIAKVVVSSDNVGNGPSILIDMDSQTFWQSDSQSGTHFIEVTLNSPVHIKEFGIIIAEIDRSYCPKRVRIFITDSNSITEDLGSRIIPNGVDEEPKAITLIRNSSTCVSKIKVLVEDSGRIDCRVRGLFVRAAIFELFDHVVLSDNSGVQGEDLNLKNGASGIVVCTPYEADGSGEQRGLIVSSMLECRLNYYRASWLKHKDYQSHVFKLGDLVQLNFGTWETGNPWLESKCLGHPDQLRYGIVTHAGVSRGGFQRNIEVTTKCSEDMLLSGSDRKLWSSLYPARALQQASQFSHVLTRQDKDSLITAIENVMKEAGENIRAPALVELYGLRVWSKIWRWCTVKLDPSVVCAAFSAWLSLLPTLKRPESTLNKQVGSVDVQESTNCKDAEGSVETSWTCPTCEAVNNNECFECRICEAERVQLAWTCAICLCSCKSTDLRCPFCYTQRASDGILSLGLDQIKLDANVFAWFQVSTKTSESLHDSDTGSSGVSLDTKPISTAIAAATQWTACFKTHNTVTVEVKLEWGPWIYGAQVEADRVKKFLASMTANSQPCRKNRGPKGRNSAPTEMQDIKADFELNENRKLKGNQTGSIKSERASNSFRHVVSYVVMKKNNQRYAPLNLLDGLIHWTDSYGSTAAHHAAFMKLTKSVEALRELGASLWIPNQGGETPAALMDGFSSLKEDGSPKLSAEDFKLHSACCKGAFFDSLSDTQRVSFIRKVISCPTDYTIPDELSGLNKELLAGNNDIAFKTAKDLVTSNCHARPYFAIAMLREHYGVKAVSLELRNYLLSIPEQDMIDPMFFYAHYLIWLVQGRPRSGKGRCSAIYGVYLFRRFRKCNEGWLTESVDLDHHQMKQEGTDLQSNLMDCETEDDDELPGDDGPQTLWLRAKNQAKLVSDSMDKLMALTGLKSVKDSAARVVKEVLLQQNRPSSIDASVSMNFLFVGNPGCGKTTVAQLLAKSLHELGFRSNPIPLETSAQAILKLSNPVKEFVDMVQNAKGGTIFIDEAYRFSPNKETGPPNDSNYILDYLLEVVEEKEFRDTTTFILAGYKDEIQKLLEYNVGFASRFSNEFNFQDFDEIQLKRIFLGMIKDRGLRLESRKECNVPLAKIVSRRIAQDAGKKGFGNARAVRNKVEEIINNQTHRLGDQKLNGELISERDYQTLTRTDVIGPRPNFSSSALIKQLDSMVGLKKVKEAVRKLVDLQLQNYDRELAGERRSLISLHRVFYGNPGTGKTTVVKIYGALLKELGLLSKGDFLHCTPADLMGTAVGGAAANTKSMLERAKGKVLFIDEAYVLDPKRGSNPYGGNVLDTLVEKLEGDACSDIAVILAGYKQEMFDMLENNAGLRRRFNIDDFGIHFEDMSDEELRKVLIRTVNNAGLVLENGEVEDHVVSILSQKRRLPNFGNAGTVQSMLSVAKVNRASRISNAEKECKEALSKGEITSFSLPNPDVLVKSDFDSDNLKSNQTESLFSKLYNIEHIQIELEELEAMITAATADKKDPAAILADCHMVFTGPPGTGKTTVARKFGELFKSHGLLPTDNVIVTSGTNLQGQYVGETKNIVIKLMQQARGGILLIDEAYGLNPSKGNWGYATEAVDTLVGQITEADFRGNLIVIMAGYANQVNEMFQNVNPGLRSRFDKKRIQFPSWTGAQAAQVAIQEIKKEGKNITADAQEELKTCFTEMAKDASWASARDVFENIIPAMYLKRAHRMAKESKRRKGEHLASNDKVAAALENVLDTPYDVSDVKEAFENVLGPRVLEIDNWQTLQSALEVPNKLFVVDYFATWCGPCKKFAPLFANIKQEFKSITFFRVDIDKCAEVGEEFQVDSVPTTLFHLNSTVALRVSGCDDRTLRKHLVEYVEKGSVGAEEVQVGKGPSSPLKKDAQHNHDETSAGQYADSAAPPPSSTNVIKEIKQEVEEMEKYMEPAEGEDPGFVGNVKTALEQACKELKYTLSFIADMLRSPEGYTKALLDLIKQKTGCDDESKIRRALDPQKAPFLEKVLKLIEEMDKEKSEEEKRIQEKIKKLSRCPMDFEWIKVEGGYQCAGGSHFLKDEDLKDS